MDHELNSIIWIVHWREVLYSYDPTQGESNHYEILLDTMVHDMEVSPSGIIYFKLLSHWSDFDLSPGELFKFNPRTDKLSEIETPLMPWPNFGKLLSTENGTLWIGIHGYQLKDGSWHLNNPRPRAYINRGQSTERYNWDQPDLIMQSSNGYLWYTNYSYDTLSVNGSAWYNPKTDNGCWFSSYGKKMAEDSNKTLWMVFNGKLFRFKLEN